MNAMTTLELLLRETDAELKCGFVKLFWNARYWQISAAKSATSQYRAVDSFEDFDDAIAAFDKLARQDD